MASMLEQAIIDAKQLRESAQKNAEETVIEKYQIEIKEAIILAFCNSLIFNICFTSLKEAFLSFLFRMSLFLEHKILKFFFCFLIVIFICFNNFIDK